MSKVWRIVILVFLGLTLIVCSCILIRKATPKFECSRDLKLLTGCDWNEYEEIKENQIKCDLATCSYIVDQMQADGYTLSYNECTSEYIDLTLVKNEVSVRIRYTAKGYLTSIASPYEKSYIPMTYVQ